MRDHWMNCITHRDKEVDTFLADYFDDTSRHVLMVAGAGFDPRSRMVAEKLALTLGSRLTAIFIREERPGADAMLRERADGNQALLFAAVPNSEVIEVNIFADDGAPVGGARIAAELAGRPLPSNVTDVILDLSALSIGVGFPAAKLLLERCEQTEHTAFHLIVASNPVLDDCIRSESSDRPSPVRGFAPLADTNGDQSDLEVAQVWIPQLARGLTKTLHRIGRQLQVRDFYKVCPVLPFPARDPRRADDLIGEYEEQITQEWHVDPRDFIYASEWNPLDTYRRLSRLKLRFDRTMRGTFALQMILSPIGSKVMAAGALMAAIEHDMVVQYVETESYSLDNTSQEVGGKTIDHDGNASLVHVILSGPLYGAFPSTVSSLPGTQEEDANLSSVATK